jgi:hypothetical protein
MIVIEKTYYSPILHRTYSHYFVTSRSIVYSFLKNPLANKWKRIDQWMISTQVDGVSAHIYLNMTDEQIIEFITDFGVL